MIKTLKIPNELRDYVEKLNYEEVRYKDLLNQAMRCKNLIAEEDFNDSYEYFSVLSQEACISKQVAMKEIEDIYKDFIQGNIYYIDFKNSLIVLDNISNFKLSENIETFDSHMHRIYPTNDENRMSMNGSATKSITLQVTDACNMACTYCYQHNKGCHKMSFETAKAFLSMILDADERTNTYITSTKTDGVVLDFIGGEPWLEIDLIAQISDWFIMELFKRKHPWAIKFMLSACSNGLLHFDERVQNFLKTHSKHLNYGISIDGNKELHDSCRVDLNGNGTYDRAIKAVHDFRNNLGGVMGSKMTIARGNVDKIYDAIVNMVAENGYTNINLNCVYEEGWTNEHANILYWQLHKITDWLIENNLQDKITLSIFTEYCGKPQDEEDNKNWCGGLGLMLALDYKGDIYPCLRYMESSLGDARKPYSIGNIQCGINQKQEHCERINCMSCITRKSQSTEECFNCPISLGCSWCSAYNYEVFGTPNKRATFICCMHKARSLANFYHWRKLGKNFPLNCPKEWAIEIIGEEEYEKLKTMEVSENGDNISPKNK